MKRRLAWETGAKAAMLAFTVGVVLNLRIGVLEIWEQGYNTDEQLRLFTLVLRRAANDGLMFGVVFAVFCGLTALVATAAVRRRLAGWIAALSVPVAATLLVAALQIGLRENFASLFPAAYASAPGIQSHTVFWVFLPPLIRDTFLHNPSAYLGTTLMMIGVVCAVSLLTGIVAGAILAMMKIPPKQPGPPRWKWWLIPPQIALAVAALLAVPYSYAERAPERPDVVLISIDTVRADALGCYGATPSPTPGLDAFAHTATRYARAMAPSPWTIPSHAGLLTGLENHRHGAVTMDARLPDRLLTLAERLTMQGYEAGAVVNSFMLSPRYGFQQGFTTYQMAPSLSSEGIVDRAQAWLRERGDRPVFLFVHLFAPHWPYGEGDSGLAGEDAESFHEFVDTVLAADPSVQRAWRERYLGEVRDADQAVERLFQVLQRLDRWDNAWVIVASDHGEEWWDHGFLGHAVTLYDEVLHVPLLIKRPQQKTPEEVEQTVSLLDVPATLIGQMGLGDTREIDGVDLMTIEGVEREFHASTAIWGEQRFALIRGCGKGINAHVWRFGEYEGTRDDAYYDLCQDPAETDNRAAGEAGQALLADLWFFLTHVAPVDAESAPTPSPVVREKLRSLGYLE